MLDLVLKLIEQCINLVRERKKSNRDLLSDFVVPVLGTFEAVHERYLSSFQRYRALVSDSTIAFDQKHPVFDKLREDIVFTAGERTRVMDLASMHFPSDLSLFLQSIRTYLLDGDLDMNNQVPAPLSDVIEIQVQPNAFRLITQVGLDTIARALLSDDQKRELAVREVEAIVERLQARYAAVQREANSLRQRLLG